MQKASEPLDPFIALQFESNKTHGFVTHQGSTSLYRSGEADQLLEGGSTHFISYALSTRGSAEPTKLELIKMRAEIDTLRDEISVLKNSIPQLDQGILEIRDISYDQAKSEIRQFFLDHHGEEFTAADIEELLGVEFEMALAICEELENEGKIG